VDDAALVSLLEAGSDEKGDLQGLVQGHGAAGDALLQRLPLHQLHDQEALSGPGAGLVRGDLLHRVDAGDIGVIEGCQDLGFSGEAGHPVGVGGEGVGEELEGHVPSQLSVPGPVHLAHAALADLLDDTVVGDLLIGFQGQGNVLF
jgi:hypothetical protein